MLIVDLAAIVDLPVIVGLDWIRDQKKKNGCRENVGSV